MRGFEGAADEVALALLEGAVADGDFLRGGLGVVGGVIEYLADIGAFHAVVGAVIDGIGVALVWAPFLPGVDELSLRGGVVAGGKRDREHGHHNYEYYCGCDLFHRNDYNRNARAGQRIWVNCEK